MLHSPKAVKIDRLELSEKCLAELGDLLEAEEFAGTPEAYLQELITEQLMRARYRNLYFKRTSELPEKER